MNSNQNISKIKWFLNRLWIFEIVFLFFIPCYGQTKLVKTQGSGIYDEVFCAVQDKAGNIWFGTTGEGAYRYDGKLFTQFTVKDGLTSNTIFSVLEDKAGNIWFGTDNGIYRYNGKSINQVPITAASSNSFYLNDSFNKDTSAKNEVWSMMQDKRGVIWFGTRNGVFCYNGTIFTHFLYNDGVINKEGLLLKMVDCILEDKNGIIWFASGMPPGMEGFCRYDGKIIESFKPKNEGWIRNVIESKSGILLLATRHFGVWSYDGKSFNDYSQPKELVMGSLNAILEDRAGNLWIASDYGKNLGDSLGGLWHSNSSGKNPAEITFTKISNKEVWFVFEDKDHNIWFGTRGMGLYRYNRKTLTKFSE
jgi:ligand-binding sensor domain-containing protein